MTKQLSNLSPEDQLDLNIYHQAMATLQKDPETISHQTLKEELGFLDEKSL